NLWFTEDNTNKIGRITPAGIITEFPIPTDPKGNRNSPGGITSGPDGNLWFTQTKDSSKNNGINLSCPRLDGLVPFAMKGVWQDGKRSHLFIRHLTTDKGAL